MDLSKFKDLKDLQGLLDLMGRYGLEEIELEGDGHKIRLRKPSAPAVRELVGYPFPMMSSPHLAASSVAGGPASPGAGAQAGGAAFGGALLPPVAPAGNQLEVTSPMVGTFYRASSPEADPFVKEGDSVAPDQTICIIEAMKVMNDIPAGVAGVVREILVKNGESVEFGQALFRIEPA